MSEPIRSTRPLGETIVTQAMPRHEDLTQLLAAEVVKWDGLAYLSGAADPAWEVYDQSTGLVIASDTPTAWEPDAIGYTFEHKLAWGSASGFEPEVGCVAYLVYRLWRSDGRGPITIEHYATLTHTMGMDLVEPPA